MSLNFYRAVENVGREVWLIKDNKIVGEGYSGAMREGEVSIEMRDDRAKALVENSDQVKAWGESHPEKKYKWSLFRFLTVTGTYVGEGESFCEELDDILVVDKFNLRYGMVPDTFKDTEGYRSVSSDVPQ
jgi:hypothetical protein